jgi:hypothetical protein
MLQNSNSERAIVIKEHCRCARSDRAARVSNFPPSSVPGDPDGCLTIIEYTKDGERAQRLISRISNGQNAIAHRYNREIMDMALAMARLRPSRVRSRIRSRSKSAMATSNVDSRRPRDEDVSQSGSPIDLNAAPALPMRSIRSSSSRVDRPSRSSLVTISTSPALSVAIAFASRGRSARTRRQIRPQVQAERLSAEGSHQASGGRRDSGIDRQALRRRYLDDLSPVEHRSAGLPPPLMRYSCYKPPVLRFRRSPSSPSFFLSLADRFLPAFGERCSRLQAVGGVTRLVP